MKHKILIYKSFKGDGDKYVRADYEDEIDDDDIIFHKCPNNYYFEDMESIISRMAIETLKSKGNYLLLNSDCQLYSLVGSVLKKATKKKIDKYMVVEELTSLGFENIEFEKTKLGDYICYASYKGE